LFGSGDNSVNQGGQEIELKIRQEDVPKMDKDKPVLTKPGDKPVLKPEITGYSKAGSQTKGGGTSKKRGAVPHVHLV